MGILYEVREDGEYDEQENAAKSSGLCCLVTVFGVIAAVIVMLVLDGGEVAIGVVCKTGLALNVNTNLCEGVETKKTCPVGQWGSDCTACLACGDHGQCLGSGTREGDGTCLCSSGWAGEKCNACANGFYGPKCLKCDDCNGHGSCNGTSTGGNGKCICQARFSGVNCESCIPGYFGSDCSAKCSVPETCVYGACNQVSGKCDCAQGYRGTKCEECDTGYYNAENNETAFICKRNFSASCTNIAHRIDLYYGSNCSRCPGLKPTGGENYEPCSANGECNSGTDGDGACYCSSPWFGEECQFNGTNFTTQGAKCSTNALNCVHGDCYSLAGQKACMCDKGYVGKLCNMCGKGYRRNASDHCVNVCATQGISNTSSSGYFGNQFTCQKCPGTKYAGIGEGCSGHGACTSTGVCQCSQGFDGKGCQSCKPGYYGSSCSPCPNCGSHGECAGSGTAQGSGKCVCHYGYYGSACDQCDWGYVMGGNGICHKCPEHLGSSCNFPSGVCAFDTPSNASKCRCESNFVGANCASLNPDHNCGSKCGANGECKKGKCYCSKGFKGLFCNVTDGRPMCSKDSDCSGTCEVCSETEGVCVLKDLCCGNGIFMKGCHCKPGFAGDMCESKKSVVTYQWVTGEFEKCKQACGPKNDSSRFKTRQVQCYRFTSDGRRDQVVLPSMCTEKRPDDQVPCNQFVCNSNVALVDLTLDMNFELTRFPISNGELTFVDFLKEDIQKHGGAISKSDIEILNLRKGSVKVKLTISNSNPEQAAAALKQLTSDADDMYKNRKSMTVLGNARSIEFKVLAAKKEKDYVHEWAADSDLPSGIAPEKEKNANIRTGEAAAISISAVFIFVGCVAGGACFLKGKWAAEAMKRLATGATASKGVADVQLTKVEKSVMENPLFSQLASGAADNLLAAAVSTLQRAIQEDEKHNFEAALPLYKKANEQFLKAMKAESDQDARFALAKRVDSYVKREQYLNTLLENQKVINS